MMSQMLSRLRSDGPTTLLTILVSVAALRGLVSVAFTTTTATITHSAEPIAMPVPFVELDDELVTYDQVQPIFRKHCLNCHNEDETRGGLSLSGLDKIEAGSTSGDVVVPGVPEESLLYLVTAHLENPKMPPNKPKIPAREIAIIEKWIKTGLPKELAKDGTEKSKTKEDGSFDELASGSMLNVQPMEYSAVDRTSQNDSVSFVEPIPLPQVNPIATVAAHSTKPIVVVPGLGQLLFVSINGTNDTQAIPIAAKTITTMAYSRDGKHLLVGCGTPGDWGKVFRLNLDSMQWDVPIGDESDTPLCMSESPDGRFLAIGNTSKNINIYDLSNGQVVHTLKKHTDWITQISWSPDGLLLASGDRFGSILVWEANSGNVFANLRNHVGSVMGLVWSADGNELFSTGWDGTLRRWNLHSQSEVKNWIAHQKGSHGLFGLSSERTTSADRPLVSYGRDGAVRVWSLDGRLIGERSWGEEIVASAFSSTANESRLIVCDASGAIHALGLDASHQFAAEMIGLTLPIKKTDFEFTIYRPAAPARLASTSNVESAEKVVVPLVKDSKPELDSMKSVEPAGSDPSVWKNRLANDLADSQRALDSIEKSRAQLIESLSQIEESAARLKQLIAIQEARLKQLELSEGPK